MTYDSLSIPRDPVLSLLLPDYRDRRRIRDWPFVSDTLRQDRKKIQQLELTIYNSSKVAFPGAYTATSPGIVYDIYQGTGPYTIPGPAVWTG